MSIVEEVVNLKKKIDQLKEKKIRNDAMRQSALKELKTEFEFDSVEEAKTALAQRRKKHDKDLTELEEDYDEFVKEFGDKLGIGSE